MIICLRVAGGAAYSKGGYLLCLAGHHYQEKTPLNAIAGKQLFSDMRILSEKIMSGEITGNPPKTVRNGQTINHRQANYGLAGLWYNPENLRATGEVN